MPLDNSSDGVTHSTSLSSLATVEKDSEVSHFPPKSSRSDASYFNSGVLYYKWAKEGKSLSNLKKATGKRSKPITINLSGTRYDVVRYAAQEAGYTISREEDSNAFVIWNDAMISSEKIFELKPFQRTNHFPGMGEVSRKDSLARNVARMQKSHPEEFNFIPKTWILPADFNILQNYLKDIKLRKKVKTFIIKPPNSSQGHGISLHRNMDRIPPNENVIVQEYIDKPLLIEGYKFDLRIYIFISSCDPLRIFLFNDGLVRLSTDKYLPPNDNNINNLFMHLTNYSINKHNENYEKGSTVEMGSKRSFKFFNEYLKNHEYDTTLIWKNISDLIIRTFIMAEPHVLHAYRMSRPCAAPGSDSVCFEILGLDILIDRKLRPWLLEINRSPSFATDEEIDHKVKFTLLVDTFKLLHIKMSDKRRNIAAEKAEAQKRLLRPSKRQTLDNLDSIESQRRINLEKRKDELRDLLEKVKQASLREDFENRNMGHFRRIFPTEDKHRQEGYTKLLLSAFNVFFSRRISGIEEEIQHLYSNKLGEQDVLDMLAECESDILGVKQFKLKALHPLDGVSDSQKSSLNCRNDKSDSKEILKKQSFDKLKVRRNRLLRLSSPSRLKRESLFASAPGYQSPEPFGLDRESSAISDRISATSMFANSYTEKTTLDKSQNYISERTVLESNYELNLRRTLSSLNGMCIKFPGKDDSEAETVLNDIKENWKYHKPRVASYWLVKLDSVKRRKVIDIVSSSIRAAMRRIWRLQDIESLQIFRAFNRIFGRLLWSHGQGLWNCFSPLGNNTWEIIFSKSSDRLNDIEMQCCRRIVQLCQDCLLVVYQFAQEAYSRNRHMQSSGLTQHGNSSLSEKGALNDQ